MRSKKILRNKNFYCWLHIKDNHLCLIPSITVLWKTIPFTIQLEFLKYELQFTFKVKAVAE